MLDANACFRRMFLVVGISALSMVNLAYAHGGKGTGGSSGGGSTSSGASSSSSGGSGHSASSTSSGHSVSSTTAGHTATVSKGTHSTDPAQSGTNAHFQQGRVRVFVQPGHGSGYNSQNTVTTTEDQRKTKRLFLGFIRY